MATPRLIAGTFAVLVFSFSGLYGPVLEAKSTLTTSRQWNDLGKELNLEQQLKKIASGLKEGHLTTRQAQSSIRFLLEKAYAKAPTFDPQLGHLLVTSAALSRLPSAMGLMEKVINPSHAYAPESWQCALQYLSEQPSEKACELLIKCLGMPWISLNLSASFYLSQNEFARHDPTLISRLQAVERRLPKQQSWIIADTLRRIDNPSASRWMRQLYFETAPENQAQILRLMASMEEDYLDIATKALSQNDPSLQEAALYFCLLRNYLPVHVIDLCKTLGQSPHAKVSQSAQIVLFKHTQSQGSLESILKSLEAKQLHTIAGCTLLAELLSHGLPVPICTALGPLQQEEDSKISLNSTLALLMSQDRSCLDNLTSLLLDDQVVISLQYIGNYSWPLFTLEWVPPKNEPIYPFLMANQYRSRTWLLNLAFRLPENELAPLMNRILSSQDEALQVIWVKSYAATYQKSSEANLVEGSNQPGKPWLRLASTLGLWNLRHQPSELNKLQVWWNRFDWIHGEGYISTLPDVDSDPKKEIESSWLLDFQTSLYFEITRELIRSYDAQVWSQMLDKMSQEHSLHYLPLLALFLENA